MKTMKQLTTLLAAALLCGSLAAQVEKDRRDVVVTKAGKEVRGRVLRAYEDKELVLLQGGKRVRIPTAKIESTTTINDHLRQFFVYRQEARQNEQREWLLVEWASSKGLRAMATLQAMHVLLTYGDHDEAHRFLGHKRRGDDWAWPEGSRWFGLTKLDEYHGDWGHPWILPGEHFRIRTNAGLRRGLAALFELERFYVWWLDTWGTSLRPREVIDPMDFHVYDGLENFPALSSSALPYYLPQPNGDISYTYVATAAQRPLALFDLASQQMLYNALADGLNAAAAADPRDRFAAWLEIGLGQWTQSAFRGDSGYAEPGEAELDSSRYARALRSRSYGLENMLGLRYGMFHDVTSQAEEHWVTATTFVAFLLDEKKQPPTRANFLKYVDLVYNQSKGNSSSIFDRTMGVKIERLEQSWVEWLTQMSGGSAKPR